MFSNSSMFLESSLSFTMAFFQEAVLPMGYEPVRFALPFTLRVFT